MKRKITTIVALVLLLIGIAYVRALFSNQDRNSALPPEVIQTIPADILDDYLKKEEAAQRLDSLHQFYRDSLEISNVLLTAAIDGRSQIEVDSLQALIEQLQKKLGQAENNIAKAKRGKTEQYEKLIAAFYNGEISQLPPDLTNYEREVSIKEVNNKAQKYFGISAKTLSRIVKNHK